jgi:ctn038
VAALGGIPSAFFLLSHKHQPPSTVYYSPLNPFNRQMNRKKQAQTELSYYGLYLLNHLRENRFPQASDADFIRERADHAAEVYEQARRDALFADAAQELAMSALLKGLRFSKYSILYDVVDSEFPLEVAVEDQEAFVKHLLPLVDNVYSIYDLTDDDFAQSPDYDRLYTELTGAVALFIESNGVQ